MELSARATMVAQPPHAGYLPPFCTTAALPASPTTQLASKEAPKPVACPCFSSQAGPAMSTCAHSTCNQILNPKPSTGCCRALCRAGKVSSLGSKNDDLDAACCVKAVLTAAALREVYDIPKSIIWRNLVYLKYWTLNPTMVHPKVLYLQALGLRNDMESTYLWQKPQQLS